VWVGAAAGLQYASWRLARYAGIRRRRETEIVPAEEPLLDSPSGA